MNHQAELNEKLADNPPKIWLAPRCNIDERTWCEDDIGCCDECGEPTVEYIRADVFHELLDPAVCRLQFPDGSVPGNAKEAAEGWKRWADKYQAEARSLKDCLEKAVRQWKLYADMEEGRDLANEQTPEGSLFRLVSRG